VRHPRMAGRGLKPLIRGEELEPSTFASRFPVRLDTSVLDDKPRQGSVAQSSISVFRGPGHHQGRSTVRKLEDHSR
jgi:hypothetical protein